VGDVGRVRAELRRSLGADVYYLISPKKEDSLIFGIKLFVFNDLNSFLNSSIAIQRTYGRYSRVSYLFSTAWVHVRVQVSHSKQLTCIPAGSCTDLGAVTKKQQVSKPASQRASELWAERRGRCLPVCLHDSMVRSSNEITCKVGKRIW
jgi:hypothetical protein